MEESAPTVPMYRTLEELDAAIPEEVATPVRTMVRKETGRTVVANASQDPSRYVEDQLELSRERLRVAEEAQQDITREVLTARRDYDKWKTLAAALSPTRPGDDIATSVLLAKADAPRRPNSAVRGTRKD